MTDAKGFGVHGERERAGELRSPPDKGHEVRRQQAKVLANEQLKQMLGFLGSVLLFLGVFMPIVSAPIIGSLNYFQNGRGDGVIILVFAMISLWLTLTRNYKRLWLTGLGSLGVLLFTFVNFQVRLSQLRAQLNQELAGNPFKALGDLAMQSIQLQWGWAVLVVGALLVVAAASMKAEGNPPAPGGAGALPNAKPREQVRDVRVALLILAAAGLAYLGISHLKGNQLSTPSPDVVRSSTSRSVAACRVSDITIDSLTSRVSGDWIYVAGRLINNCDRPTGVEIKVTVYDKTRNILTVQDAWPASVSNIPAHGEFPFETMIERIPGYDALDVRVINVNEW